MGAEKAARAIERIANPLSRVVDSVGRGVLAVMMLLIAADVVLRYVINRPIKGSYELIELMLVLIVYLGLAYTQAKKGHIGVDLVVSRFSPGIQGVINSTTYLLCLGGFLIITWRSIVQSEILRVEGTTTGLLHLPLFPFMWIVALGSVLLCLMFLIEFLDSLSSALKNCRRAWLGLTIAGIIVVLFATFPIWLKLLPWQINQVHMGLIGVGLLILLLFSKMLIGPVMVVVGFLGFTYLAGIVPSLSIMGLSPYRTASAYELSTIPLFVFMGMLCFHAGLSSDIFYTLHRWIGHFRGGLAMATVGACGGFAAVSGSSIATAITMATVALPEMRRYKYADGLACGAIAAGGTVGILIPPSIPFIIYAQLTEQSIGKLFMAGILPGIMEVTFYMIAIYIITKRNPQLGPPGPKASWRERLISLKGTWGILALFVLVMGGIYLGVFTATEAAGIGAFGALLIGFAKRKFNRHNLFASLEDAMRNTSLLFIMLIGADIFSYFLTLSQVPFRLSDFVVALQVPNWVTLTGIILVYIFLGCIMPIIPAIILTVPIFFPVVTAMGYDPIWYGVLMVLMAEMGQITPPVGMNVFVTAGVAKDVPMYTIFRGIIPFFIADLTRTALLVAFPAIALFLPTVMMGK